VRGSAWTLAGVLKQIPDGRAVWLRIEGFRATDANRITVRNTRTGAAMEIATDQPATRMAFYSSGGVLSPEPFVEVKVRRGDEEMEDRLHLQREEVDQPVVSHAQPMNFLPLIEAKRDAERSVPANCNR